MKKQLGVYDTSIALGPFVVQLNATATGVIQKFPVITPQWIRVKRTNRVDFLRHLTVGTRIIR